jgi:hypothetical protein
MAAKEGKLPLEMQEIVLKRLGFLVAGFGLLLIAVFAIGMLSAVIKGIYLGLTEPYPKEQVSRHESGLGAERVGNEKVVSALGAIVTPVCGEVNAQATSGSSERKSQVNIHLVKPCP